MIDFIIITGESRILKNQDVPHLNWRNFGVKWNCEVKNWCYIMS